MTPYSETCERISALLDSPAAQDCIRFKDMSPAASVVRGVAHELALLESYLDEMGDRMEKESRVGGTD